MKHNEISALPKINLENFENIFNVHQDNDNMYYYNLLQTISFPENLPLNLFDEYTVKSGDTWPYISHVTLKNPGMWWIILLVNNIKNPILPSGLNTKTKNIFGPLPGTTIKIPIAELIREILIQMRKQ